MDPEGHRLPVANAATVQRLTRMSAEEHEARLRYDAETVFQLQLNAWSDRTWAPVAEALAEYGYAVMVGWLYTGRVYGEVSAIGKPVPPCPSSWLDDHEIWRIGNLSDTPTISQAGGTARRARPRRAGPSPSG